MGRIYTGLVAWNLVVLAAAGASGALVASGRLEPRIHQLTGLFTAVFGCLVHSLLVIHFIGSMKWIQQTGPTAGFEDTKQLRRRWFRGSMFPVVLFTMLAVVATAVVGGRVEAGPGLLALHVCLAAVNLPLNLWAIVLARRNLHATKRRMGRVAQLATMRVDRGLVTDEPAQRLLPESERAGGKVFLFLAANVWLLWIYHRLILRRHAEPIWPYAVACVVLAVVGFALLRSSKSPGQDGGAEAP